VKLLSKLFSLLKKRKHRKNTINHEVYLNRKGYIHEEISWRDDRNVIYFKHWGL